MIQVENQTIDGRAFTYTYSDAGFAIRQDSTGQIYDDALDLVEFPQTYTETDIPLDPEGDPEEATYAQLGRILLGDE